jgi:hypothetical protein
MFDWHSERFKKFAVWLMAILAALFLVTGFSSKGSDVFGIFRQIGAYLHIVKPADERTVKVAGEEVDPNEYDAFVVRWKTIYRALSQGRIDLPVNTCDFFFVQIKLADKLGIVVSDKLVNDVIQSQEDFAAQDTLRNEPAGFSPEVFKEKMNLYAQYGLSEDGYRQYIKESLMMRQLEEVYTGRILPGVQPFSPLKAAETYADRVERRRVLYFKASILSFMQSARDKLGAVVPDDDILKKFYDNANQYIPPRKVKGDYLYVNVPKLIEVMQAKGLLDKAKIEAEVRDKNKNIQGWEIFKFYDENKDKLYRKPAAPPVAKPAANKPDAAEGAVKPGKRPAQPAPASAPATAEPAPPPRHEYISFGDTGMKARVTEDLTRQKIDDTLRQKSLDTLYKEVEDCVNAASRVNTRDAAAATMRDVSMSNFFEKLAAFLKVSIAQARWNESLADLKPVAEKFKDAVQYGTADFFTKETAAQMDRIGGTELARVPDENGLFVVDIGKLDFDKQQGLSAPDRKVYVGGISGYLTPAQEDSRYIFRISDVKEDQRPDFAALTPERKDAIKKDYVEYRVKQEAYRQLFNHWKSDSDEAEQNPDTFPFDTDADNLDKDEQKYTASQQPAGQKPPKPPADFKKETGYFNRTATEIQGIGKEDVTAFRDAAFKLLADGKYSAVVRKIEDPAKAPAEIDLKNTFYYVIKLTDKDPVLRPSLKQYEDEKARILRLIPVILNNPNPYYRDPKLLIFTNDPDLVNTILDTLDYSQIRKDYYDQIMASLVKTGYTEEKEEEQP